MQGSSLVSPRLSPRSAGRDDQALALRLAREFTAPVGLLDPTSLSWRAREGLDESQFPDLDATLTSALASGVLWHGRVSPWRPNRDEGPIWLCLPAPKAGGTDLLAIVGFAPESGEPSVGWGPRCPDRALRAWGQSVADSLRGEAFPRTGPAASTPKGEGGERLLAARLIRRMRISDAPEHFQDLALKAVRGALKVAAVAWVPSSSGETIVVAGEVEGMRSRDFRGLVPEKLDATVHLSNSGESHARPAIRRVAVVASESQSTTGWLVAINPIDDRPFASNEVELLQPVASLIGTQRTNGRLYRDLKEMLFGIIRALTAAIDAKDPYTSGHSERVARIAVRIAEELGMPSSQRGDLYLMGLLHDVGKIGIDDGVLKKTGPLTPDEYRKIQDHVKIGVNILNDLKKLHHLLPGVASHHESFDGKGYPENLVGENIPLVARILAVADAFDAMSSVRPYRKPLTPTKIDEIFRGGAGTQWDPKIVQALFACRGDIEQIRQKGLGISLVAAVDDMVNKFK
jgi:HD-GYP domain-containing protein (c-di-GMP phosphodiesterase class II)